MKLFKLEQKSCAETKRCKFADWSLKLPEPISWESGGEFQGYGVQNAVGSGGLF